MLKLILFERSTGRYPDPGIMFNVIQDPDPEVKFYDNFPYLVGTGTYLTVSISEGRVPTILPKINL